MNTQNNTNTNILLYTYINTTFLYAHAQRTVKKKKKNEWQGEKILARILSLFFYDAVFFLYISILYIKANTQSKGWKSPSDNIHLLVS